MEIKASTSPQDIQTLLSELNAHPVDRPDMWQSEMEPTTEVVETVTTVTRKPNATNDSEETVTTVKTTRRTTRRQTPPLIPRLLKDNSSTRLLEDNSRQSIDIKRILENQERTAALLRAYKDIIEKNKLVIPDIAAELENKSPETPRIAQLQREVSALKAQRRQFDAQNQPRTTQQENQQAANEVANLRKKLLEVKQLKKKKNVRNQASTRKK